MVLKDLLQLTKPRITMMSTLMTWGGLALSPHQIGWTQTLIALLASSFIVASANALNMFYERKSDALMERTANRPLPAKRMQPVVALIFGIVLCILSLWLFFAYVNTITGCLALLALFLYVFVYTPLKFHTPLALFVGAVPGAIPPLLGWTAATNDLSFPGIALFLVLFIWQIPHFLAIALLRKDQYANAGIKVLPVVVGEYLVRRQILIFSVMLLPISLLLLPTNLVGWTYGITAGIIGFAFSYEAYKGLYEIEETRHVRRLYFGSLFYLPLLIFAIVLDLYLG
jgi:protoheme IX farnesyltransferase